MRKILVFIFLAICAVTVKAQSMTITGTVTDASDGEPLVGVTVMPLNAKGVALKGVSGTSTDVNGNYTIKVNSRATQLRFTYIGMETKTVQIKERTRIDIKLETMVTELGEVVVTAMGLTRDARSLNYSRQSVNAAGIAENNDGNLVSALAGKIAGVNITPPGVTNGSSRIVIRGTSSLTENSQPVFVVDGMILESNPGDNNAVISGGNSIDYGNPMSDINPEDIESIEILKGPNAAALYGSRAAQGVVLITTKKSASFDRARITYNGNFQWEKITQFMDYQDGWGTGENYRLDHKNNMAMDSSRPVDGIPDMSGWTRQNSIKIRSWGAPLWGQEVINQAGDHGTYSPNPTNVKDFYSTAHRYTNTLTVDGGNKANNYRVSYTHTDGNSVVHGINESKKDVFNVRLLNTVLKGVTMDTKGTYSYERFKNRQSTNGSNRNPIYAFVTMPRDLSVAALHHYKDEAGNELIPIGEVGYNPYWCIYENQNSDQRHRFSGTEKIDIEVPWVKGLKLVGKVGVDAFWWQATELCNIGSRADPDGSMSNWNNNSMTTNFEGMFLYNNRFKKFTVNAMFGGSLYSRSYERRSQGLSSIVVNDFGNISNSYEIPTVGQTKYNKKIRSVFGSLSLGYSGWLYLDITARNDWSSTLPSNNNSYFYPSFGGSFIFTDAFKIDNTVLSFGKLRASYAYAGADTDPYRISTAFNFGALYNGGPLQTIDATMNNNELKPERTKSLEIGGELKFWNDRLGLDVTYYRSDSYDLITKVALAPSSGYSARYVNTGHIRNKGYEVALTAIPVQTRNFSWTATVNWSLNRSLVVKVADGNTNLELRKSGNVRIMLEEGQPYGILRGKDLLRDDQGHMLVNKTNGKPLFDDEGTSYLGCAEPKWRGSFGSTLRYRDFSLSFLFDCKIGGSLYSGTWKRATTAGVVAESNEGREAFWRSSIIYGESGNRYTGGYHFDGAYTEDGIPTPFYNNPRDYFTGSWDSRNVFDASFIKFRELSLTYSIPRSFMRKQNILSAVKLSFIARNLGILYQNTPHGIDPEASISSSNGQGMENSSMPPSTSWGFNVNVQF